jgi:hypothetical protein
MIMEHSFVVFAIMGIALVGAGLFVLVAGIAVAIAMMLEDKE